MKCAVHSRASRLIQLSMLMLAGAIVATSSGFGAAAVALGAEPAAADSGSIPSDKFSLNYRIEGTGASAIVIGFPNYYGRIFSENLRSNLRLQQRFF